VRSRGNPIDPHRGPGTRHAGVPLGAVEYVGQGNAVYRLELHRVGKRYGRLRVFRGIEVELGTGQVLVVAGRNGSGKSTLLRIIAGLVRPTAGQVLLFEDGRWLSAEEKRRRVGLVAVDVALYSELTARENLAFFARVRGLCPHRARSDGFLEEVGLAGRGDDLVQTYSSGMRQRLKFACSLLHEPPLLLLDEPSSGLDEEGAAMVEALIARQRLRGLVVLATNDPREVDYGDSVLRLGEEVR
jgi:heme exporter protein A